MNESIEFDIKVNGKPAKDSIEDVEQAQVDLEKTTKKTSESIKTNWSAIGMAVAAVAAGMAAMMKQSIELERALFGLNEETREWIKNASEQYGVAQNVIGGFVQMGKAAGLSGDAIARLIDQGVAISRQFNNLNVDSAVEDLIEFNSTGVASGAVLEYLEKVTGDAETASVSFAENQRRLAEATKGVNAEFDKTSAAKYDKALQELSNTSSSLGNSLFVLAEESGILWAVNKVMQAGALAATGYAMAMNRALAVMYDVGNYDTSDLDKSFETLKDLADNKFSKLFGVDQPINAGTISVTARARPLVPGSTAEADKEREIALRANERFWNEYNRATQTAYEYELGLLDKQFEEYNKHVTDKAALDEWYNAEKIRLLEVYDSQMRAYADMADTITQGLTDGILEFTETGKLNFKSMANSIIQDMLKIQIQSSMMSLMGGFSSGGGGLFGSLFSGLFAKGAAFDNGNVTAFAQGGVVDSPTVFPMANGMGLMGEAGAEAVMPLSRTSSGDLGVKSTAPIVNVNVQNYGNDEVKVEQNGDNINVIISQIATSISRGTGDIGTAIEGRYGIRKA